MKIMISRSRGQPIQQTLINNHDFQQIYERLQRIESKIDKMQDNTNYNSTNNDIAK